MRAGSKRSVQETADRFRYFAEICRARAKNPVWSAEQRAALLHDADRWERDAERVLRDADLIERSRELLKQIHELLTHRGW